MTGFLRRTIARWGASAVAVGLGLTMLAVPASAQDLPEGDAPPNEGRVGAVVVVEGDSDTPLAGGGSATEFSLGLPDGAACPGDSATGNWRIQSFLAPATDDPGTFTYQSTKPAGEGRWALYPLDTRSYINRLTAVASEEGGPGIIDERPVFSFVLFPPDTLPDGTYKVGFACTLWNETYRYWDTEIVITNTESDEPAQLVWEAIGTSAVAGRSSSSTAPLLLGLFVIVVAGLVVVVVIRRGRRSRPPVSSQEER